MQAGGSWVPRRGRRATWGWALPDPSILTEDTTSQSCSGKGGYAH